MDEISGLSEAKTTLLAVHFASSGNVQGLAQVCQLRSDILKPELVLRIVLTYLPETLEISRYLSLLQFTYQRLVGIGQDAGAQTSSDTAHDVTPVTNLSDKKAASTARRLQLLPIMPEPVHGIPSAQVEDLRPESERDLEQEGMANRRAQHTMACFIVHRARRIDAETGLMSKIPQLVEPFLNCAHWLRLWYVSRVIPILRWNQAQPSGERAIPLSSFELMDRMAVLGLFLQSVDAISVHAHLRELVGPWLRGYVEHGSKEEQKGAWRPVYEWLLFTASSDFPLASHAVQTWEGPSDADFGNVALQELPAELAQKHETDYAQAMVATMYAAPDNSDETLALCYKTLLQIAELLDLEAPPELAGPGSVLPIIPKVFSTSANLSPADLTPTDVLRPGNPLTTPTEQLMTFVWPLLQTTKMLERFQLDLTFADVMQLYFFGPTEEQLSVLHRVIATLTAAKAVNWQRMRSDILWLWGWGSEQFPADGDGSVTGLGALGRLQLGDVELELLRAMLTSSHFQAAKSLYVTEKDHVLPLQSVAKAVYDVAMTFYDNASNGNKTRGGVKLAADAIAMLYPSVLGGSEQFKQATHLIAATHALSFYSLTLQHGVVCKPVNIRVHSDPISLILKVLEQNPRSYTKVDDLTSIALHLVDAGLGPDTSLEDGSASSIRLETERRVMAMAIEAALAEDDFGTAYSYIVNRLLPTSLDAQKQDDVLWRAAFEAGKFRPSQAPTSLASSLAANLTRSPAMNSLQILEMRLELLSRALLLAPPSALPEILTRWRKAEEEMNSLVSAEADADETPPPWSAATASEDIPGAFEPDERRHDQAMEQALKQHRRGPSHRSSRDEDETPMGLFDVASNAAKAFRRSAFPLSAGRSSEPTAEDESAWDSGWNDEAHNDQNHDRTRTRDKVGNLVTGSLVSGIGWVIGAQPNRSAESSN